MHGSLPNHVFWCIVRMYCVRQCNFGRSSNGRTAAFEAVNLGSIPSLPANLAKSTKVCYSAVRVIINVLLMIRLLFF